MVTFNFVNPSTVTITIIIIIIITTTIIIFIIFFIDYLSSCDSFVISIEYY